MKNRYLGMILPLFIFLGSLLYAIVIPLQVSLGFSPPFWMSLCDLIFSFVMVFYIYDEKSTYLTNVRTNSDSIFNLRRERFIQYYSLVPFSLLSTIALMFGLKYGAVFSIFGLAKVVNLLPLYRKFTASNYFKYLFFLGIPFAAVHIIACGWILLMPPLLQTDFISMYIDAIYWAISRLLALGFGDLNLVSNEGKIFNIIVMVTGVGIYGIIIGKFTQILFLADKRREKTREKFHDLNIFMHHYDIPSHLQHEILSYYKNLFTQRITENDHQIITELPTALQQEIHLYMSMKLLGEIPLFKEISSEIKREIARKLEQISYAPLDLIFSSVDQNNDMYLINHGSVDLIHDNGSHLATLKQGQSFGEAGLVLDGPRTVSAKSKSYSDLYRLRRDDFYEISSRYPELKEILTRLTSRRASDFNK